MNHFHVFTNKTSDVIEKRVKNHKNAADHVCVIDENEKNNFELRRRVKVEKEAEKYLNFFKSSAAWRSTTHLALNGKILSFSKMFLYKAPTIKLVEVVVAIIKKDLSNLLPAVEISSNFPILNDFPESKMSEIFSKSALYFARFM